MPVSGTSAIADDPGQRTADIGISEDERDPLGLPGLALGALLCLLLVPYAPGFAYWPATLRFALVYPLAGWGSITLVRMALAGDIAARWAGGFIVWMFLAASLSPEPRLSILGGFADERGWLQQAGFISLWAIGRRVGENGRRYGTVALLVGLGLNAALIVAQTLVHTTGLLALSEGRAVGFTSSSVFAGALMAGAIVLVAALIARSARWWLWLPFLTLFATAGDLTGSRIALLMAGPLAVAAVVRHGWQRIAGVTIALLVGLVVAGALIASSGSVSSTSRLAADGGGGGVGTRLAMWGAGAEAAMERPLTGWGPGRFRTATSPRITAEFAVAEGPDKVFFDAHNLVIEQLVTSGITGVVLLGGFAWSVRRRVEGPLAWFGLAIGATWLLEPVSVVTAPVALIALGLASTVKPVVAGAETRAWLKAAWIGAAGLLVVAGTAHGLRVAVTAHHLHAAETELSVEAIESARKWFPRDPALSDTETQIRMQHAYWEPSDEASGGVLEAARRTVALEASNPLWWSRLAIAEARYGPGTRAERVATAQEALDRALEQNPWSLMALTTHHVLALETGDAEGAAQWEERLCAIDACPEPPPEDTEDQP